MDEVNLNFRAKQATMYDNGVLIARFVDEDFMQFELLQEQIQTAIDNKPEAVIDPIADIDSKIAELQAQKADIQSKVTLEKT